MLIHTLLTHDSKNKGAAMLRSAACTPYRSNYILQELGEEFLFALGPNVCSCCSKPCVPVRVQVLNFILAQELILQILLTKSQVPSYWVLCPLGYQLGSCWNGNVSNIPLELQRPDWLTISRPFSFGLGLRVEGLHLGFRI